VHYSQNQDDGIHEILSFTTFLILLLGLELKRSFSEIPTNYCDSLVKFEQLPLTPPTRQLIVQILRVSTSEGNLPLPLL
jgi:hypothetical protein